MSNYQVNYTFPSPSAPSLHPGADAPRARELLALESGRNPFAGSQGSRWGQPRRAVGAPDKQQPWGDLTAHRLPE